MDIERLKVDREYWDSLAPEGATHYAPESCAPWERIEKGQHHYFVNGWIALDEITLDGDEIPRPIRPKEQRQREELKQLLEDNIRGLYCFEDGKVRADVDDQIEAILSRYNLEPKQ